ncbi:MAG: hypothetical protein WD649_04995 [Thermoleophilaceae bacterium]
MPRPRLLLLPNLTELEWVIRPLIEQWAEVASFDAPGVGDEPAAERAGPAAILARGHAEIDRLGWDRFVIAADEFAASAAAALATERREAVQGMALGHASLAFRRAGERPTVSAEIVDVGVQMFRTDFRAFVREEIAVWDPRRTGGRAPEERDALIDEYLERVSAETAVAFYEQVLADESPEASIEPLLRELGGPLLLAEHEDCPLFTREGYEDIVAAFPDAATVSCPVKPSMSLEFAVALRSFCERIESPNEARPARPG